jgi:hypothetical protein
LANQIQADRGGALAAAELAAIPLLPVPVVNFALQHGNLAPAAGRPEEVVGAEGSPAGTTVGMAGGRLWVFRDGRPMYPL